MKSQWIKWVAIAVVAGLAYSGHTEWQTWRGRKAIEATQLDFQSFDQALAQAKAQGKPVLVDFSATWCPSCLQMHRTVFTDPAVKALIGRDYILAMVDSDAAGAGALMDRYGVQGFPTLLVLDGDGQALRSVQVSFDPATFAAALANTGGSL